MPVKENLFATSSECHFRPHAAAGDAMHILITRDGAVKSDVAPSLAGDHPLDPALRIATPRDEVNISNPAAIESPFPTYPTPTMSLLERHLEQISLSSESIATLPFVLPLPPSLPSNPAAVSPHRKSSRMPCSQHQTSPL